MTTDNKKQKLVLRLALAFAACVLAFVGFMIARYHPSGIVEDGRGNIVLATTLGDGETIPVDSIENISMPEGLMTHLIRTNGASYGRVKYGHFINTKTGTKMFLYLTGQPDTVCFKYNNRLYVTDDWRK